MPSAPPQPDFKQNFNNKREKFVANGTAEEEFERSPAVEADLKDMDKRKRVSSILNSEAFRKELELVIDYQLSHGPHPASVMALQHLADMLLPSRFSSGPNPSSKGASNITPISDLRGVDASGYSKGERFLRCKLASIFRLVSQNSWSENVLNHISARVTPPNVLGSPDRGSAAGSDHILINPFGLQYHEVSASTLVKIDSHGNIVHPGSSTFGVNKAGSVLHTAIHQSRPDVRCVLHLHQTDVQAVSALKCGLLRCSLESCILGNVSYHSFEGITVHDSERESIARDLGAVNKVMMLRNHGAVVCGSTLEETWELTTLLVHACVTQLKMLQAAGGNVDNLELINDEAAQSSYKSAWSCAASSPVSEPNGGGPMTNGHTSDEESGVKWKFGELHFEALMRDLDNVGMRTGYIYKNPMIKMPTKPKFDVEVPPASSSMGYFSENEALRPTRNTRDRYIHSGGYERTETEIFSDGDDPDDSKTRIKWIRKDDNNDLVKIDGPHQFAPVFSGKQEMKNKIGTMKDERDANKTSAGYHSKILDGLSQTDQRKYAELQGTNQNVVAFSKGIIQKDYQKDAVLLTDYSAPNPFEAVTDDEVENYKRQAQRRAQGLPEEEPQPSPYAQSPASPGESRRFQYEEKKKKNRAQTLPPNAAGSPTTPTAGMGARSDTETGAESERGGGASLAAGMTTETETEGAGGSSSKSGKAKKSKSFKNMFSAKGKNK
jgi:adducin